MKKFFRTFYGKLSAIFLVLLLILGIVQVLITVQASMRFVDETDQKLNTHLARDMAAELKPALTDSLSLPEIEYMIHYMMVMNPKVEIYLLDQDGKILAFFADPRKKVQKDHVELEPIHNFLDRSKDELILGDDPRHPGRKRPFSAATIRIGKNIEGYLYIIIGGELYDTAASLIRESYILKTTLKGLLFTLLFTGIIGLTLFFFMTKRLRRMTQVVKDFEKGHLDRRIPVKTNDEIGQVGISFNKMADTIVANMEELKQTDDLRRELVANVSHDLRSPLASIQGYIETIMMKESELNPEDRLKYLETILNNTTLLSKLVEELFELSKLDAKQIQPKPEPFSIAELTQDIVMKFRPKAEKTKINLKTELPQNLPLVYGDIGLIERALSNLMENAIQYTPANGIVKVELSGIDHKIRISISDNGLGIPKDELPHIFERFYRVEKSRSREKGGTGLGLAIAKKILEIHDSDILVESEINVGTRFYFDLKTLDKRKI